MNLAIRAASALIMLPVVLAAIHFGGVYFFGLVTIALAISLHEALGLVLGDVQRRDQAVVLGLACGAVAGILLLRSAGAGAALAAFWLGLIASAAAVVINASEVEEAARRWVGAVFAALYAGVPLLLLLPLRSFAADYLGARLIYLCMATTWANDTLAYFCGRAFGKRPLHQVLSPKKTWEGFYGGGVGAVVAACVCQQTFLPEIGIAAVLAYALVMALVVPLGDLSESLLKRAIGLKDSGDLIPGHGGLLDRIDGLLFALPWTYLFAVIALAP